MAEPLGFVVDWEHRFELGLPHQDRGVDVDVPDPFGDRLTFFTPR